MNNVEIYLLRLTENTHKIERIVHEGKVIAEFDDELGKIDLSGLFKSQDRENSGLLITSYKDRTKETKIEEIHFTITLEEEGYALNVF